MNRRINWLKLSILVAMSIIGLAASTMVLVEWNLLHQNLLGCSASKPFLGIVVDCGAVLSSKYSNFMGIPLEVFGVFYFVTNLVLIYLIAFGSQSVFRSAFRILFVWRFLGVLIVPYLLFIEFVLLKAICLYCTTMHIAILVDFGIVTYFLYYKKDLQKYLEEEPRIVKGRSPTASR